MLPIYQLRLIILGVYGSAQGMAIALHAPAFCLFAADTLTLYSLYKFVLARFFLYYGCIPCNTISVM
jgi:hypothetical protein